MKKTPTLFLKIVIWIVGLAALGGYTAMVVNVIEHGFGQEVNILLPLLCAAGLSLVPFLIALYEGLRLLQYIDRNTAFSEASVKALRYIKYSATSIGVLYILVLPFFYQLSQGDDAPGFMLLGILFVGASIIIAVFAAVLQKLLRSAIDLKLENELTV